MGRAALVCLIALLGLIVVGFCDVAKLDRRASRRDAGHSRRDSRKDTHTHTAGATRKDTHTAVESRGDKDGSHFDALHARHDQTHFGRADRFRLRDGKIKGCGCIGVYWPVCGDDGNTYDSSCEAKCANVDWVYGECAAAPAECICTSEYVPVCGEDGNIYINSCVAECANVAWVEGECAAPPTGCPDVPADYMFYPGEDSPGNDIQYLGPLDVADLAAACTANPDCYGFNSNGWIKHTIVSEDKRVTWTDEACVGLYVYALNRLSATIVKEDSRHGDRSRADRSRADRSRAEGSRMKDAAGGDTECACTREYWPVCGDDGNTYANSCEAECANVDWVYGECPPPPAECPEVPAEYVFYPGKDSPGNDIQYLGPLDVADLAAACTDDSDCYGFNSNGWIKHTIVNEDKWVTWTDEPCLGLYVYDPPSLEDSRADRSGKSSGRGRKVSPRDGKYSRRDRDHLSIRRDRKFVGGARRDRNHMG